MKGRNTILTVFALATAFLGTVFSAPGASYTLTWGYSSENVADIPAAVKTNASNIAAGYWHTLAIVKGNVEAWGTAEKGVTNVPSLARQGTVTKIAAGDTASACVANGQIVVWGGDTTYMAGPPNTEVYTDLAVGISDTRSGLTGQFTFGLGLTEEARVEFWGTSFSGSGAVQDWRDITAVAAGRSFAMGLSNGCVLVAGAPYLTTSTNTYGVEKVPEEALSGVKAIAAGPFHCMALTQEGKVLVWGAHADSREVAAAIAAKRLAPRTAFGNVTNVPEVAKSGVKAIAAGYNVCAALLANGQVVIWGSEQGTGAEIMDVPAYARQRIQQVVLGKQHVVVRSTYQPPEFTTDSLPIGRLETEYSAQLTALAYPAAKFFFANPDRCPPGLAMSTAGTFSGIPTKAGTNSFEVVASNAYGSVTNSFYIFVDQRETQPPAFVTTNLPVAQIGFPYSQQIEATESPTFSIDTDTGYFLPDGLTLSADGLVSGIPTTEGTYYPTIVLTNEAGSASQQFTLEVTAPTDKPVIGTVSPLPDAVYYNSTSYSNALSVTGATNVYISAGATAIPGLSVTGANSNWALTGVPQTQGDDLAFTLTAQNSAGSVSSNFTITIHGPPVWQTPAGALPTAYLGQPYETVLWAKWGDTYVKQSQGNLPAGLTMSTRPREDGWKECVISGTPTVTVTDSRIQIRAENAYDPSTLRMSRTFALTVLAEEPPQYEYQFVSMSKSDTNLVLAWTNLLSEDTTAHLLSTTNLVTGWPTNNPSAWGSTVTSPATVPMPTAPAATFFLLWPPNSGN